ncbi:hypothetical protein ACEVJL_03335 [Pseudoflavonifractor sp. P01025]|uniref:hypothetical protein n=1 Tax=Flintibacter porci TaxID=3342383 RepID=UPI0035B5DB9E
MSAGICIMNKNAIALAADSAVTIGQHLAIHNSANKLFALSKIAPVGVIIYSNAELMGVPMELIIKQYKSKLKNRVFPNLIDYVSDFLRFLVSESSLLHFPANENSYVKSVYTDLLSGLNGDYQLSIQRKINEVQRDLTEQELKEIQIEAVKATLLFVDQLPAIPDLELCNYIRAIYNDEIKQYISAQFPWIVEPLFSELVEKTCLVFDKNFMRNGYVGLAFAGYGENNIFPQMLHLHISGIANNMVRYATVENISISEEQMSTITPLAQTDVMQTFLFGINDSFINDIAKELPNQIQIGVNGIADSFFAENKKQSVQQELSRITSNIIEQIVQKAQQQYLLPITQSVATLPIEELALLAESMINITSLRRKVALDNNIGTVGGPIDVAIISKCDGFIWLKRKHYFDRAYNPQYFYSHYMLSESEDVNNGT